MGSFDINLDYEDILEIEKLDKMKIMRGEFLVNETTSPYKTIEELWDGEIWSYSQCCNSFALKKKKEENLKEKEK